MEAKITRVVSIRPLGDNLSVVGIEGSPNEIVSNRRKDGSFRWSVGEVVAYLDEGFIVPDDVLQERGYWDTEKQRGLLEGKKYNRIKMRRFGPEEDRIESRGLLFKVMENSNSIMTHYVTRGNDVLDVNVGDDVGEFFGLTVA